MELLKFDRKQLRAIMANLKNDKLVKTKIRLETSTDGKSQRHNYYFINYQVGLYHKHFGICMIGMFESHSQLTRLSLPRCIDMLTWPG